uniref:Phosphate transporter n=1 Tax=Plectus sambesii TaxID=2011161 RepID=A0A914VCP3_9BILA
MMDLSYSPDWLDGLKWTVIAGFCFSFLLSFGMGANNCANAWGTSVGSGVLRLWQAYILSSIFDVLGAGLLGYRVTDTIQKGIIEIDVYNVYSLQNETFNTTYDLVPSCNNTSASQDSSTCSVYTAAEYVMGALSALLATAIWLILASVAKMPASATQSIIGASLGYSLVLRGTQGIKWKMIIDIVVAWFTSPILAGIIASIFYLIIKFAVMRRRDPFEAALKFVPVFFWFTLAVNLFTVFYEGSKYLHFDKIPWWGALIISNGIGLLVALLIRFFFTNWMRKRATRLFEEEVARSAESALVANRDINTTNKITPAKISIISDAFRSVEEPYATYPDHKFSSPAQDHVEKKSSKYYLRQFLLPVVENRKAIKVFHILQVLSACFLSFADGANNTANSVGPLLGIYMTYKTGLASGDMTNMATDTQLIILFGVFSMVIGFWVLGHRVIKTIANELTEITASSGFAIELGTAFTVLIASKLGIPISVTDCAIGAIIFVGIARSSSFSSVSWRTLTNIVLTWIITIPATAGIAALITYLLVHFYLGTI